MGGWQDKQNPAKHQNSDDATFVCVESVEDLLVVGSDAMMLMMIMMLQGRRGSSGSSDKPTRQAWLVFKRQKQLYRLLKN